MQFKDVIGNSELKIKLAEAIDHGRVSHAQLFLGKEGSGNLAMANAYVQYLFCTNKQNSDSCGACANCKKISSLSHPDVHYSFPIASKKEIPDSDALMRNWRSLYQTHPYFSLNDWHREIDIGNKQSKIAKDEANRIAKKMSLKSYEGGYKVMIIWLPESMNATASNKLLKLIEEPPKSTLFLLVSEDQENIITTIRSRAQLVKIPRPSSGEVKAYLISDWSVADDAAEKIAHLSDRNLAEAYHLIRAQEETAAQLQNFIQWMRFCYSRNITETIKWVENISKIGRENQKNFLKFCLQMYRQCMLRHYTNNELVILTQEQESFLSKFAPFINHHNIISLMEETEKAHYHVERNANPKILFLDLSFKMFAQFKKKLEPVT